MSFNDDDLKRLKEHIKVHFGDFADGQCQLTAEGLQALVARLEVAELLAECLSNHEDLDPVEVTEITKWRKAAGK